MQDDNQEDNLPDDEPDVNAEPPEYEEEIRGIPSGSDDRPSEEEEE